MKRLIVLVIVLAVALGGSELHRRGLGPFSGGAGESDGELRLSGNIEIRDARLQFFEREIVAKVMVDEGDVVTAGQVLAELRTERLESELAQARASRDAQAELLRQLENGSRPQEIAQARSRVESARAQVDATKAGVDAAGSRMEAAKAQVESARARVETARALEARAARDFDRHETTVKTGASSATALDAARAQMETSRAEIDAAAAQFDNAGAQLESARADLEAAQARLAAAQADLDVQKLAVELAVAGPREEDRARAGATLAAFDAAIKLLETRMADCRLLSPAAGVVDSRNIERGEMAEPGRAAFTVALTERKWVRAYVAETELGLMKPGAEARILSDTWQGKAFSGKLGHVSSVAEFTPKAVATEDLRTRLVYEIRVWVEDPDDELRLGMPVTVVFAR